MKTPVITRQSHAGASEDRRNNARSAALDKLNEARREQHEEQKSAPLPRRMEGGLIFAPVNPSR